MDAEELSPEARDFGSSRALSWISELQSLISARLVSIKQTPALPVWQTAFDRTHDESFIDTLGEFVAHLFVQTKAGTSRVAAAAPTLPSLVAGAQEKAAGGPEAAR